MTSATAHWERAYREKDAAATSWYRPHLELSLQMIAEACDIAAASIVDVGGGASTLVDDAVAMGCGDFTVLDIAAPALDRARARLGPKADRVHWIAADITTVELPEKRYDVWHDRAAFHFLVRAEQRVAYRDALLRAVRPGGHVIIATFGPDGPQQCSGLEIVRYDAASLAAALGGECALRRSELTTHLTPGGVEQQFLCCRFQRA